MFYASEAPVHEAADGDNKTVPIAMIYFLVRFDVYVCTNTLGKTSGKDTVSTVSSVRIESIGEDSSYAMDEEPMKSYGAITTLNLGELMWMSWPPGGFTYIILIKEA